MKNKTQAAPAGEGTVRVIAVTRALALLDAFGSEERMVTLGELGRRTKLHKTTVLRLARTMAAAGYLVQTAEGGWRLGPATGWLGARYHAAFDQSVVIEPLLRQLSGQTGESAAFYVREGNARVCVARVDGSQSIRYHARIGQALAIDRGATGRVLLAFSGEPGALYERIRRTGHHVTAGERDPEVASVAFPVFGINQKLIGCVCVSGPLARFTKTAITRHIRALKRAAAQLTYELGSSAAGLSL